jgi:hypothetical protein
VNPCGLEPQLIKLEFIIYLPKLKVVMNIRLILYNMFYTPKGMSWEEETNNEYNYTRTTSGKENEARIINIQRNLFFHTF